MANDRTQPLSSLLVILMLIDFRTLVLIYETWPIALSHFECSIGSRCELRGEPFMTMGQAVHRVTGESNWFGIDAGVLDEGKRADLVM